ncbi:MAG: glutathione S-transferase family protein [Gammaproteobacteria bacterium]|nr:glutathione S-transferase family protein [Gammaproteobacteria bacterium]
MIEIHHARRTRGFRVIWLCEELSLPYRVVKVDMSPSFRSSPQWRSLSPTGKVPVMSDGDCTLYESGAMLQLLLARYGKGRLEPIAGSAEHGTYLQWCWFAEATFARPLGEIVNHRRVFGDRAQAEMVEEMAERARLCAAAVDQALTGRTWLLGDDFSAADVMMGYTLRIYRMLLDESLPGQVAGYFERLCARPAYQATEQADNAA